MLWAREKARQPGRKRGKKDVVISFQHAKEALSALGAHFLPASWGLAMRYPRYQFSQREIGPMATVPGGGGEGEGEEFLES